MNSLAAQLSKRGLTEALEALPTKIGDTYKNALRRIMDQDEPSAKMAHATLLWLSHARRLLTVAELKQALSVQDGATSLDEDAITDKDVLVSVCAGLVIFDKESNVIRLVHYTAQKFIERSGVEGFPDAQTEIAKTCLTYLLFDIFWEQPSVEKPVSSARGAQPAELYDRGSYLAAAFGYLEPEINAISETYPLFSYAALFWQDHVRETEDNIVQNLALDFLEQEIWNSNSNMRSLIRALRLHRQGLRWERYTGLHVAVFTGLKSLTEVLFKNGADINDTGAFGRTALSVAADVGDLAVTQMLLEHGANVGISSECYCRIPLSCAILSRNITATTFLSSARANILAEGFCGGSVPLQRTISNKEKVIEIWLAWGADVNAKDGYGVTPLEDAVTFGCVDIFELLLNAGADIETRNKKGHTALLMVAKRGKEDMVKLLSEKGANLDLVDPEGSTPLMLAAKYNSKEVVGLLLLMGVDVKAKNQYGCTALSVAVENDNSDMGTVKLLLENGAEIQARNRYGQTVLFEANQGRNKDVDTVKLLLDNGADINARDHLGKTALLWAFASHRDNTAMIKLLLVNGADTNAKDKGGKTVLFEPVERFENDLAIFKLVLANGAYINARDKRGRTVLFEAIQKFKGDPGIVELLLGHGSDINAQDYQGRTVFFVAVYKINIRFINVRLIKLLLKNNVGVTVKDIDGVTPLSLPLERSGSIAGEVAGLLQDCERTHVCGSYDHHTRKRRMLTTVTKGS